MFRISRRTLIEALVAAVVVGMSAVLYRFFLMPGPSLAAPRIVQIKRGENLRAIAENLKRAEVIRSALALRIFARMSGGANRLQPGDYKFHGGETVAAVLGHMVRGESLVVTVTIPEGSSVRQVAERLEMAGLVCDWKFIEAARNSPLSRQLGLAPMGVEGYLFPATYRFAPSATADQILFALLARFFAVLTPQVEQRAFEMGLSTSQLVTLASMIEKEAKVPAERPLIASVFYNRLRLHMPLQSDPTAQYSFDGILGPAAQAVHTPSAFNTYDFTGLPPGPIANPGWSAIHAALYPAPTDYLYFVARTDGSHVFSRTLKEHDRAIASARRAGFTPAAGTAKINPPAHHSR
jgi:peptidoglycan lytic transglycosylase G